MFQLTHLIYGTEVKLRVKSKATQGLEVRQENSM
jgi:hypothetical protein